MRVSVVATVDPDARVMGDFCAALACWADARGLAVECLLVNDLGVALPALPATGSVDWRLLPVAPRRGQFPATLDGIRAARGDAVLAIDPDLHGSLDDVDRLLAAQRAGAELVFGYRVLRRDASPARRAASALSSLLVRRVTGLSLRDVNTPVVLCSARVRDELCAGIPAGLPPKLYMAWRHAGTLAEVPVRVARVPGKRSVYRWRRLGGLFIEQLRQALRLRRHMRGRQAASA